MSELEAIIFDMDGTLADTEEIHRQAFNLAFAECGYSLNWSRAEYRKLLSISGGRERIRHCLQSRSPAGAAEKEPDQSAGVIHKRKSDLYRDMLLTGNIGLRPGIRRLVDECGRAGLQLAIATSSSGKNVDTLLRSAFGATGNGLFSAIVTCDEVAEKKPSPAVYHHTLTQLGLAPENCIAMEDTTNGNLAALAAGIKTVITTHPLSIGSDFSGASLVVNQLGEPGKPFKLIAGNPHGRDYVDLALLRSIHAADPPEPVGPGRHVRGLTPADA